jgi:hypothetical protein
MTSHPNEDIFNRPFTPEVHPTPSREEEDCYIEFGKCGGICRTNQGRFLYMFHGDCSEPCAVFETIEDCRKFDLDLSLTANTFCHFKDWGQKEHYERRRMHSLRAIRQLTKTWGERRIPSYFKYEYYGLLVRDNLDSMMDDKELREMYESDGDSAPSKDSTRWYASLLR